MTTTFVVLEIGRSLLEVEIEYEFQPGEKRVDYFPDGSGYPGSADDVEFRSVYVDSWVTADQHRRRGGSAVWEALDIIARREIEGNWECYRDLCLKDAQQREEA